MKDKPAESPIPQSVDNFQKRLVWYPGDISVEHPKSETPALDKLKRKAD